MSARRITRDQFVIALNKVCGLGSDDPYEGDLDVLFTNSFIYLEESEPWQNIDTEDFGVVITDLGKYFVFDFSDEDIYYFCKAEDNEEDFFPVLKVGIRRGDIRFEISRQKYAS